MHPHQVVGVFETIHRGLQLARRIAVEDRLDDGAGFDDDLSAQINSRRDRHGGIQFLDGGRRAGQITALEFEFVGKTQFFHQPDDPLGPAAFEMVDRDRRNGRAGGRCGLGCRKRDRSAGGGVGRAFGILAAGAERQHNTDHQKTFHDHSLPPFPGTLSMRPLRVQRAA